MNPMFADKTILDSITSSGIDSIKSAIMMIPNTIMSIFDIKEFDPDDYEGVLTFIKSGSDSILTSFNNIKSIFVDNANMSNTGFSTVLKEIIISIPNIITGVNDIVGDDMAYLDETLNFIRRSSLSISDSFNNIKSISGELDNTSLSNIMVFKSNIKDIMTFIPTTMLDVYKLIELSILLRTA